jgi:hypothetical protein
MYFFKLGSNYDKKRHNFPNVVISSLNLLINNLISFNKKKLKVKFFCFLFGSMAKEPTTCNEPFKKMSRLAHTQDFDFGRGP